MINPEKICEVLTEEEKISFALRALYSDYGYKRYKMSKFEEYDLYVNKKDYLVSENIITFTDTDGKLLALKPDVTLSILKSVSKNPVGIAKLQYSENVYRVWQGDGFRELMQTGVECIGELYPGDICEVLFLAHKSLGEISKSFALEISDLDFADAVIRDGGIYGEDKKEIINNLGRKNVSGIKKICERLELDTEKQRAICALAELYGSPDEVIEKLEELDLSADALAALIRLKGLCEALAEMGASDRICIDFSLMANRKYYNGIAFGGFIEGMPECVLRGGQYDKLAGNMGIPARAIGFAVYLNGLTRENI